LAAGWAGTGRLESELFGVHLDPFVPKCGDFLFAHCNGRLIAHNRPIVTLRFSLELVVFCDELLLFPALSGEQVFNGKPSSVLHLDQLRLDFGQLLLELRRFAAGLNPGPFGFLLGPLAPELCEDRLHRFRVGAFGRQRSGEFRDPDRDILKFPVDFHLSGGDHLPMFIQGSLAQNVRELLQSIGISYNVGIGKIPANVEENAPAVLPLEMFTEVPGIGEQPERLFRGDLRDPRLIVALVDRNPVNEMLCFVAGEFLGCCTTLPGPFLGEALGQGDLFAIQVQHGGNLMLQIVFHRAVRVDELQVEVAPIQRILAEEEPTEGIEKGCLATGILSVDFKILASRGQGVVPEPLEIFEPQLFELHDLSLLI